MSDEQMALGDDVTRREPAQSEVPDKPKATRRRTITRKAATAETMEAAAAASTTSQPDSAAAEPSEASSMPVRRRAATTRKKAAAPSGAPASEAAAASDEAEAKPVRRRRQTTKRAAETAVEADGAGSTQDAARAPRSPRAARGGKKAASTSDVADAALAEEAAEPSPKTRRRTRKAAADADATQEGAANPEVEADQEKPTSTRASAGRANAKADAAAADSDSAEKPEAPRRRRRSRAVSGDAGQDETVDSTAAHETHEGHEARGHESHDGQDAPTQRRRSYRNRHEIREGRDAHEGRDSREGQNARRNVSDEARPGRYQRNGRGNGGDRGNDHGGSNGRNGYQGKNGYHNNKRGRNSSRREPQPSVTREELAALKVAELRERGTELGLATTGIRKAQLVDLVYDATLKAEGFVMTKGILDIVPEGYGFLRTVGYLPSEHDAFVPTQTIRRYGMRKGDEVAGQLRPAREGDKYPAIHRVDTINGVAADEFMSQRRPRFADLTPIYPNERLTMEHGRDSITARMIDLVAPIGKGQRGLIVSPPKAGKTTVLKNIAAAISANNPSVHLMCLLVDERPEEVTDMQRSIKGEVVASTFDMPSDNHIAVSELVIERAKRLVEMGEDVVILLDSITRLARAYNLAQPASGRILSGGVDSTALYPPKRFLGAARNIENGGSLTILASALIDTGSKMDEVIFEEFKGTGNMELKLDRNLADRRIFPAIDVVASGTRKEELLIDPQQAPFIWGVRRILANLNNTERATDTLIKSLKRTSTNDEFLIRTAKRAQEKQGQTVDF